MERLIRTHEDLAALRKYAGRREVRRIRLESTPGDLGLDSLADRVNQGLRSCGCFAAAIFCVASLATLPWLVPLVRASSGYSWGALAALAFAYVCSAALVGKMSGILIGHWRLKRDLDELGARLSVQANFPAALSSSR